MATHSNVLAWRIPGTGEPVDCRLWGRTESQRLKRLSSSSTTAKAAGRKISTRPEIYHLLQLGAQPLSSAGAPSLLPKRKTLYEFQVMKGRGIA